jgi:polar amino acid transport system ATP-binding protein
VNPIVSIVDVHKSFGTHEVLRGLSLDVYQSEIVCILGASGSGKSTLLRTINHLETIDSGRIYFRDELVGYAVSGQRLQELSEKDVARQRQKIGMVFQHFNLFGHMTALQNVMEGPTRVLGEDRDEVESRARAMLNQVGLAERADAYPHQLSGGQQQRVAIARALAMRPDIILFDEPTSALDPELISEVLTAIRKLAATGITMVIVTHEIAFAREIADTIVVMADGTIVEKGSPSEVLRDPKDYRTRSFLARVMEP